MNVITFVVLLAACFLCLLPNSMVLCKQVTVNAASINATETGNNNKNNSATTAGEVFAFQKPIFKSTNATETTIEQLQELDKEKGKTNSTENVLARKVTNTTTEQLQTALTAGTTTKQLEPTASTSTTTKAATNNEQVVAEGVVLGDIKNNVQNSTTPSINSTGNQTSSSSNYTKSTTTTTINSSTTASTSSTTSTTTTTTTTTPKPTKPKITYGMGVHTEWETNKTITMITSTTLLPSSSASYLQSEPLLQSSRELSLTNRGSHDYIVPLVTVLLTVPLAIGVAITLYRRFRDFWSTRHYRRMDFLVDGMYND